MTRLTAPALLLAAMLPSVCAGAEPVSTGPLGSTALPTPDPSPARGEGRQEFAAARGQGRHKSATAAAPVTGTAPVTAAEIVGVQVGFAGHYKAGLWTPVEVRLRGTGGLRGGQVSVVVPDGDGVPSRVSAPLPFPAPAESRASGVESRECGVVLYAKFGRAQSDMTVELFAADTGKSASGPTERLLARRTFAASPQPGVDGFPPALPSDQELIGVLGPTTMGLEAAVGTAQDGASEGAVVVRLDDVSRLPTAWYGYEAVSTVVLSTSKPEIYHESEPGGPRLAALEQWVRLGGKLVLCVGQQGESIVGADSKSALKAFCPGTLAKMVSLRQTGALENLSGTSFPIPLNAAGPRGFQVPQLSGVDGRVEVREGNIPLVVRRALGFGQVIFLAADLDRPPLDGWRGRSGLVARLLDRVSAAPGSDRESSSLARHGFTDIAGQLRSALDRFDGVRLIPFWFVVAMVLLYIAAIGPGDYFFLRKLLGRMELTWVTFPAIVIAFSAGAYYLTNWAKGDKVRVNQVDLVDVDVRSGLLRGTSWAGLFTPEAAQYDLLFQPSLPGGKPHPEAQRLSENGDRHPTPWVGASFATQHSGASPRFRTASQTITSWFGLPGSGLGRMDPKTDPPAAWRREYQFAPDLAAIRGVALQTRSTKSLTARWFLQTDIHAQAELSEEDNSLEGSITNTLEVPLIDCILAHGRWAYLVGRRQSEESLGRIEPGESVRLGPGVPCRELSSLLTGQRLVFDAAERKERELRTPYDPASVDIPYILRAMMFFDAAGGRRYTGLSNSYQAFVDLSALLKTDRAVLIARVPEEAGIAGAELRLATRGAAPAEGPRRHTTVYRFVFPVKLQNP